MALKRQTPSSIILINDQIKNWLRWNDQLKHQKPASDKWYNILRERNACYEVLIRTTGLTLEKVNDLIYNKTNTSSYWLADGTIRKEHP